MFYDVFSDPGSIFLVFYMVFADPGSIFFVLYVCFGATGVIFLVFCEDCVLGLFLVFFAIFGNVFVFSSCFTEVFAVWGSNLRNPTRKSSKSIVRRYFSLLSVIFIIFLAFLFPLPSQPGSTAPAYATPSPNARSRKRSESDVGPILAPRWPSNRSRSTYIHTSWPGGLRGAIN